MKMKRDPFIRKAMVLFGVATISTIVASQVLVPSKLSGKWTTPDGASSQAISASIDAANSKGTLTVWSNISACTISNAAIAVSMEGEKLILKVDPSYTNPCRSGVSVELIKKAGSDDYEGELRQGGRAGAQFPVLRVKMSP
jgi:hypothetical protein